ncbi:MAG: apolipoprotein N-acyltransferase [Verrucomicrobiota bacterium]
MKFAWPQPATLLRYGWAALGGAALACAFPKVGLAGLAWVAPGWLLFGALAARGNEAFRVGFVGGLAYSLVAFYWLLLIPFPAGAIAGWLALSAYLGLYVGAWVWLSWKGFPAGEKASFPLSPLHQPTVPSWLRFSRTDLLLDFAGSPLITRAVWALWGATVWVALEMLQARLFTGFPWNLLGVSQYQILPVVQLASVTGVYGISFLLIWFSIAAASAVAQVLTAPDRPRGWVGDLVLPLLSLAAVLFFGASELAKRTPPERSVTAVLVQPSIPQTLIWDPNQNATRFAQLIQLSERALRETTNAQILVWPEASVPNMLRYERETYEAVTNLAIVHQVWIILGSDDAAPRPGSTTREVDYYNSSFLITPRGELAATYQKRKLVIFGEYIPLERWFPFMKWLTPVERASLPGKGRAFPPSRAAREHLHSNLLRRHLPSPREGIRRRRHRLFA